MLKRNYKEKLYSAIKIALLTVFIFTLIFVIASDPEIGGDPQKIVDHVAAKVKPGSIILLHVMYSSRTNSVKSIEGVVNSLKKKGYEFVTVSELLKHADAF